MSARGGLAVVKTVCCVLPSLVTSAMLCGGDLAHAQTYPSKAVRILVPTAPGSGADVIGRLLAEGLTRGFGQQVIVDNRGGASSNLGAEYAARAPADGYTEIGRAHV